jgi:hypothetical protein
MRAWLRKRSHDDDADGSNVNDDEECESILNMSTCENLR